MSSSKALRRLRSAPVAIGVVATVAALVLAGCGSSKKAGSTSSAPVASGSSTSAPSTGGGATTANGVTPTTVKLGVIVEDYPKDNSTPFFFRTDAEKAEKAIIDAVNTAGGVDGRQIIPTFEHVVPGFDPKPFKEACLNMKKAGVFAVISGYAGGGANQCFMTDNKMPVIDTQEISTAAASVFKGYHLSALPSLDRTAKDWVYGANALGLFDKAKGFKKLGIISETCEADIWDNPKTGIKHWLSTVGVTSSDISEFRTDCTLEALLKNHQAALLKHRQDGVNVVMIAAQPLDRNYTALAQKSGFHPQYVWGDFHFATQAANAQSLNQDNVNGSYAITSVGQTVNQPAAQTCSGYVTKAGLPGFKAIQGDLLVMNFCSALNIFKAVAEKAGPNLTAESFVAAAPTAGEIPSAVELDINFQGETNGGQKILTAKWDKSTTSWVPQGSPVASYFTVGG